ncbi:guanine nucleotide-binding protein G(o) subunit alpha-like [Brachyhypopomus gauderio]|uniref:guanine nucleotide-binding protein G(o) subunit alpha-like n=1 Tax=Brachyhypopomus gauderio TaxID=698409 RepID=UPI0040418DF8
MFRCFDPTSLQACLRALQAHLPSRVSEEEKRARNRSAKLDRELQAQARREMHVVRVLMLGTPESGKSTLLKQMKIIHNRGFTKEELSTFKPAVLDNLFTSMKFVLHGMGRLHITLANKKNKAHAHAVLSCDRCVGDDQQLLPFLACSIYSLWGDAGVRAAAARGHEYQLNDSALYFFDNLNRIIGLQYLPTEEDVLRVRVRTSGVVETQFIHNHLQYRVYDVGAHQLSQKKCFSHFDDVMAVMFVVALTGYDRTVPQNPSLNCLQESLELFTSICNNTFFRKASLILFMNKTDLFCQKIIHSGRHLRLYYPEFKGPDCDVNAAAHHLTSLFLERSTASGKPVFPHFTNATHTSAVRQVLNVVLNTVVHQNLEDVSLL